MLTLFCAGFFYYFIKANILIEGFHDSWQFQAAAVVLMAMVFFIWLECKLVFDEMMQVVTIRRGLTRIFPATQVRYGEIDRIILKRHAHEDEDGHVTNEYYFHLRLNNGKIYLMLIFNEIDAINDALDQLKKHIRLKITSH